MYAMYLIRRASSTSTNTNIITAGFSMLPLRSVKLPMIFVQVRRSYRSYVPLIEPATTEDLKQIANDLKLGVSSDQLQDYLEWVNKTLKAYDGMRDIEEETIPVLYPRIPGIKPRKKDNLLNAWASRMVLKGAPTGLLAGKRLAIKDNIFIAGTPLQNGSKIWDGYTPEFDATVVTRILQAGGAIIGKSTCENQCRSGNSFTSASGPVLNPHDKSRSAGGSSSGSAVLVATGEVDMALGTDQTGSVRIPSCWSGCVGLKPTLGLVPYTGALGMEPTFDHIGPMASNVTDVATLLEVIAGYDDGRDHRQRADLVVPQYSQMLKGDLAGVKLGYVMEGFKDATLEVKKVIDAVVVRMREAGAIVEEFSLPLHATGTVLTKASLATFADSMLRSHGQAPGFNEFYNRSAAQHLQRALHGQSHDLQPTVKFSAMLAEFIRRKDGNQLLAMAANCRLTMKKVYDEALDKYDALIMPTIPFVAAKLPDPGCNVSEFIAGTTICNTNTAMFSLTGQPSLSLPVGVAAPDDGGGGAVLPVGLMISCKHFEDAKLLDISFGIEKLLS